MEWKLLRNSRPHCDTIIEPQPRAIINVLLGASSHLQTISSFLTFKLILTDRIRVGFTGKFVFFPYHEENILFVLGFYGENMVNLIIRM